MKMICPLTQTQVFYVSFSFTYLLMVDLANHGYEHECGSQIAWLAWHIMQQTVAVVIIGIGRLWTGAILEFKARMTIAYAQN